MMGTSDHRRRQRHRRGNRPARRHARLQGRDQLPLARRAGEERGGRHQRQGRPGRSPCPATWRAKPTSCGCSTRPRRRSARITHLVNSAGIGRQHTGGGFRRRRPRATVHREFVGLMLCCREAARRMSTKRGGKGGAMVNVSSMAGTIGGRPGASAYAASKAAVDSFTMGFAKDVAPEGIRVDSLRPGMMLTEMTERPAEGRSLPRRHRIDHRHGPRRPGPGDRQRHPLAAVGRSSASSPA